MITAINRKILKSSVPITNNRNILSWMVNNISCSYKNNEKTLSANLISELTTLFGKHSKALRLEFFTKVWILEHGGLEYNIFSSNGKGTSIEIVGLSYDDIMGGVNEKEIINFLVLLHKEINLVK